MADEPASTDKFEFHGGGAIGCLAMAIGIAIVILACAYGVWLVRP